MTALAIALGIAAGVISYVPHVLVNKKLRAVDASSTSNLALWFFAAITASFVILLGCAIACNVIAHDVVIPFALAELFTFVVAVFVLGVIVPRVKK